MLVMVDLVLLVHRRSRCSQVYSSSRFPWCCSSIGSDTVASFCCATGPISRPGHIHRIDVTAGGLPDELQLSSGSTSSHAFGVAETIALARILGKLPPCFIVYAVEGACFAPGAAMTPTVAAAAETVARSVLRTLRNLRTIRATNHRRCDV